MSAIYSMWKTLFPLHTPTLFSSSQCIIHVLAYTLLTSISFRNKTSKKCTSTVFCECLNACVLSRLSHVQLFVTLWIIAHQSPLSPISQARILEWVAKPSNRWSSQPRDQTHISYSSWIADRFFTTEPLRRHQLCFTCNQFFLILI